MIVRNDLVEYFWEKIELGEEHECWNWIGGIQSKGYGSFGIGEGKTALAHRVAYTLAKGAIPDGLVIRHKCDNRLCCNPNHLELGTVAQNNHDAVERGRNARGEKNGRAKLTKEQVVEIRRLRLTERKKINELARLYGVHFNSISNILKERYWTWPEAK